MKTTTDNDMKQRAARALSRTWDAIGYDILAAYSDPMAGSDRRGVSADDVTLTRQEVVEAITACGYTGGYPEMYGNDKEAVQWLSNQSDRVKSQVHKLAFPHTRYGT